MIQPSAPLRAVLRALRARRAEEVPWTALCKPLAACRLALVVGSVCLVRGDPAEYPGVQIGEPELREIGDAVDVGGPVACADGRAFAGADNLERTVALALSGLRAAVSEGRIGELDRRHLSLCGPMAATGPAVAALAPRAAALLIADQVDVGLLVPT
jgi:hypothetical protein